MEGRMTGYRISVTPQGRGRFLARYNGKVLHQSTTQPLFDCARILVEPGAKEEDCRWMEDGVGVISISSAGGEAAKLTGLGGEKSGPAFGPCRAFDPVRMGGRGAAEADARAARGGGRGLTRKRL